MTFLCSLHRFVVLASAFEALLVLPVALRRVSPNHVALRRISPNHVALRRVSPNEAAIALDAPLNKHVIQKTHLYVTQLPGSLLSFC